jgi:hypothetical protein
MRSERHRTDDRSPLQYHINLVQLLALCTEGKNVYTEIKCHSLLPLDDIVRVVTDPDCIPEVRIFFSLDDKKKWLDIMSTLKSSAKVIFRVTVRQYHACCHQSIVFLNGSFEQSFCWYNSLGKLMDCGPKGVWFNPRLDHKRHLTRGTASFSMWYDKILIIVDMQWNLWNATLQNEDILWNEDTYSVSISLF